MFERFTDRARRVVVLAQEEARTRGGHYVETQDVLTALLVDGDGPAADVLSLAGFTPESLRSQCAADLPAYVGDRTPFSLPGRKALEYALREALQLGHNYVGTEHILLGLIREGESKAAQLLAAGPGLDALRHALIKRITASEVPGTAGAGEADLLSELTLEGQLKELAQHMRLIEGEVTSIGRLLRSRETEFRPVLSWRLKLDELDELEERVAALESSNERFGTGGPSIDPLILDS